MTHLLACWCGDSSDVGAHRLRDVIADEFRRLFLRRAADLTDHDDRVRLGICLELCEAVDERRSWHRVSTDSDARAHADALLLEFIQRLIRQRARTRHDADVWTLRAR